ncbi:methyltransferase domain-containing protein [Phellopilus nigrolimitatus]|nr:methyltransferase domain-containing protein [Phellopilus nigrolimitatus]
MDTRNVRLTRSMAQKPVVQDGIDYWKTQPASLDGVLGGFGTCTLPRVDALGSRQFLLSLLPELSVVPSAIRPLNAPQLTRRTRALDVGAGIGRVTSTVLLHLIEDVVLLEPVEHFVREAFRRVSASKRDKYAGEWKGVKDAQKSVTVVQGTLQDFDPRVSPESAKTTVLGRLGYSPPEGKSDGNSGFDVVWCQWCLGHLSDEDLVTFLKRARESLRSKSKSTGNMEGLIVVKENICPEVTLGEPRTVFDAKDSCLTRSDLAWKDIFASASLKILKEDVQPGFPEGLYSVKMYALQ